MLDAAGAAVVVAAAEVAGMTQCWSVQTCVLWLASHWGVRRTWRWLWRW